MCLKPSRRDPSSRSLTDQPRSVGKGPNASRCSDSSDQYASALSTPPGASSAIPTMTMGSEPSSIDELRDGVGVFVEIEMPAVEHQQREYALGVGVPALQHVSVHPVVVAATEHVNVGVDPDVGRAGVTVERIIIGSYTAHEQNPD